MRVTPIPDGEIMDATVRIVVGPPRGEPPTGTIRPVEALLEAIPGFLPVYRLRCICEDGDAERLAAGEPFWLSLWGQVVPFDVAMTDQAPDASTPLPLRAEPETAEYRRAEVIHDVLVSAGVPDADWGTSGRLATLLRLPDES